MIWLRIQLKEPEKSREISRLQFPKIVSSLDNSETEVDK